MSDKPLSVLMVKIAELAGALGVAPVTQFPQCWELTLEGPPELHIAMNGHKDERTAADGTKVDRWSAYLTYNGWPWCLVNPYGGSNLGGPESEDVALVVIQKAIDAALAGAGPSPEQPTNG